MRSAARGLVCHMAGYAGVHVIAGVVLAWIAVAMFTPGGEAATRSEAAMLQLFITAVLLACSGVGTDLR